MLKEGHRVSFGRAATAAPVPTTPDDAPLGARLRYYLNPFDARA